MKRIAPSVFFALIALLIFVLFGKSGSLSSLALSNWPDIRFASAGQAASSLGDLYYYNWNTMSAPTPPDEPSSGHAFARIVGKLNDRSDGLSCNPCNQIQIDQIYAAEEPKILDLLSRDVNKGGVWIVGNEANYFPKITPELHAYQFKKYRDLLKSADPSTQLAHSGMLFIGWPGAQGIDDGISYLGTFLTSLAVDDWPDIYNIHVYPSGNKRAYYNRNVQQVRDFRNFVNSKGGSTKPVWVTEFGMNTAVSQKDANTYMDLLVKGFVTEHIADRWFWFIGSYEPGFVEATALTKDGQPTQTGLRYKGLATQYASL